MQRGVYGSNRQFYLELIHYPQDTGHMFGARQTELPFIERRDGSSERDGAAIHVNVQSSPGRDPTLREEVGDATFQA